MSKRRVGSNPTFPTTICHGGTSEPAHGGQMVCGAGDRVRALLALPWNQNVVAAGGDVGIRAVDVVDARLQLLPIEKLLVFTVAN